MSCSELRQEALAADAKLQESLDTRSSAFAAAQEAYDSWTAAQAQADAAKANADEKGAAAEAANAVTVQDSIVADKAFDRYYACIRGE